MRYGFIALICLLALSCASATIIVYRTGGGSIYLPQTSSYTASNFSNLTLADVVANVGNWTLDKPNYCPLSYAQSLGNWSNAINNCTQGEVVIGVADNGKLLCAAGGGGVTLAQVAANMGNLSGENASLRSVYYSNVSDLRASNITVNTRVDNLNTTKATGTAFSGISYRTTQQNVTINSTYLQIIGANLTTGVNLVQCVLYTNASVATTGAQFQINTTNTGTARTVLEYFSAATTITTCSGVSATTLTCAATASQGVAPQAYKMFGYYSQNSAGALNISLRVEPHGTVAQVEVGYGSYCRVMAG